MSITKGKVMFIDTVHPVLQEMLQQEGYICADFTGESEAHIRSHVSDYQGIVIRSRFKVTKEFLQDCHALKFIARSGSGLENIDLVSAKKQNIKCFNSPEGNKDALAEHCVALLLNLFNNINKAHTEVSQGKWLREENRGVELKGKTVGIIGYGIMGQCFAEKLAGFGVNVIAHDLNKTGFETKFVKEVSMNDMFRDADVVSLHVNYTEDNYHMINQSFIDSFTKQIYLINSARGKCLNTNDLINSLEKGKILGACLDVLELETTAFEISEAAKKMLNQLSSFEQIVLSPHVGGWTNESYYKLSKVLGDKIIAMDH